MTDYGFNWDDDTALDELRTGVRFPIQVRAESAERYLRLRLAGLNRDEAAEHELIFQQGQAEHVCPDPAYGPCPRPECATHDVNGRAL